MVGQKFRSILGGVKIDPPLGTKGTTFTLGSWGLKNDIPSAFSVISLIIALLLGLFQDGRQNLPKFTKFTEINYVRKFSMAEIQDGRQNCMKNIYLALKAKIQRNLAYDTYSFL